MRLLNDLELPKEEISLLELINKDRTNINSIKFLTHSELVKDKNNQLVHLTYDVQKFMLQLRAENPLIETRIDEDGEFSNFLFRLKNSNILNSVNILKYIQADIPYELKSVSDGTKIYTIKFFAAIKNEITEEECDELVENDEVVIMEEEKFLHIEFSDFHSLEKYWTEDVYKAIYFLKKKGFYTGLNDPDKKVNMELLREFASEDTFYLFTRNPITIDNLKNVTMAQVQVRTLPTNLKCLLKKKFKKFQNKVKKPENLNSKFSQKNNDAVLLPDEIDSKYDKKRLPTR